VPLHATDVLPSPAAPSIRLPTVYPSPFPSSSLQRMDKALKAKASAARKVDTLNRKLRRAKAKRAAYLNRKLAAAKAALRKAEVGPPCLMPRACTARRLNATHDSAVPAITSVAAFAALPPWAHRLHRRFCRAPTLAQDRTLMFKISAEVCDTKCPNCIVTFRWPLWLAAPARPAIASAEGQQALVELLEAVARRCTAG